MAVCHVPGIAPEVDGGSTAATGTPGSTRPCLVASGAAAAAQSAAAIVPMVPTGIPSGVAVSRPEATGRAAAGSLRLQMP